MADAATLLIKLGFRADTNVLANVESKLDGLNNKLRFIAGTQIVQGLFHLSERFGESAFEIQNAAAAAGITTDALQRLQYAALQSGVETSKLGESMFHLSRILYSAKMGGQEAMQTFYQLGIDTQQISSFKNAEDALYGVMDALKKIQDPIKQQALIEHLMGRGSRDMVRFALAGSEAAKATGRAAGSMGALVSDKALEQLAKGRQALLTLHKIMDAFWATLGAKFSPIVISAAEAMEQFYAKNKALIGLTLQAWVDNAAYAIGFFVGLMETAGKGLVDFLARHIEGVKTIVKFAGAIKAISVAIRLLKPALAGISMIGKGAGSVLGFLFEAGPIILATLVIGALTAALHDLWKIVSTGGQVKPEELWLYQLTHGVGPIGEAIQWTMGKVADLVDFFAPGTMRPQVTGSTVNGMRPDDPHLLRKAAAGDALSRRLNAPGGLLNTLGSATSPSADMSPAAPTTSNYYKQATSTQQVINMTANINANNLTPEQSMKAITDGIHKPLQSQLQQASRRFDSPLNH